MQKFKEQYIVNEKGKKTAVIIPIKEYEGLLEDLHDIAIVAERRDVQCLLGNSRKDCNHLLYPS